MDRAECKKRVRAVLTQLRSVAVRDQYLGTDQEASYRLCIARLEVALDKLTNADLKEVNAKLAKLSPQMEAAIEDAKARLAAIENLVKTLQSIGKVLGVISKVLGTVL